MGLGIVAMPDTTASSRVLAGAENAAVNKKLLSARTDFIGRQLQSIQADLQQIKFAADVDRRNVASQYDNLVVAVGVKIGAFEAAMEHRLNVLREELLGRFDRIEQLLNKA
jgi:NADH dehydrogenase FAD-containing subunit